MPDISAFAKALAAIRAAKDIAETMVSVRDTAAFNAKMIEFQSKIIDANNAAFAAQDERTALLDEIRRLQKKVAEFENWEAEKRRYQLTDFGGDTFAYLLKPDIDDGEPLHRLCAACFQKRQKSILQFIGQTAYSQDGYRCPNCGNDFFFGVRKSPPMFADEGDDGGWMSR